MRNRWPALTFLLAAAMVLAAGSRYLGTAAAAGAAAAALPAGKIRAAYFGVKTPETHAAELKAAGFNTMLLKVADVANQRADVSHWAGLARKNGLRLYIVVNLAGSVERNLVPPEQRRPGVDAAGKTLTTNCPLLDEVWQRALIDRAALVGEVARDEGGIEGFILDPEVYGPGVFGFGLGLCYCDHCFGRILKQKESTRTVASVPAGEREAFLVKAGWASDYERLFEDAVRGYASRAREGAQHLLFGMFLYQDDWLCRGLARGMSAPRRPVSIWHEKTYVGQLLDGKAEHEYFDALGVESRIIGGHWLGRLPPRNTAAHCYSLAAGGDGYWVFTTGTFFVDQAKMKQRDAYYLPAPAQEYWAAFREANAEVARKEGEPGYRSGLTIDATEGIVFLPERPRDPETLKRMRADTGVRPAPARSCPVPREDAASPHTRLRVAATVLLYVRGSEEVRVEAESLQLGTYPHGVGIIVLDPDLTQVAEAEVRLKKRGSLRFTAPREGIYTLLAYAGSNAFVLSSSAPSVLRIPEAEPLAVVSYARRLYFAVPKGLRELALTITPGGAREKCNVRVLDSEGKVAAERRSLADAETFRIPVPEGQDDAAWSVHLTRPDEGVFEDVGIDLGEGLPPYLAEDPAHLMR